MILNITTTSRPLSGTITCGKVLKDSRRRGFIQTEETVRVRVKYVVDSREAPNGFYVIGTPESN
jgi:hypothetical protein